MDMWKNWPSKQNSPSQAWKRALWTLWTFECPHTALSQMSPQPGLIFPSSCSDQMPEASCAWSCWKIGHQRENHSHRHGKEHFGAEIVWTFAIPQLSQTCVGQFGLSMQNSCMDVCLNLQGTSLPKNQENPTCGC